MDNPFERFDLDPRDGIEAITARLKELAEDAETDAERERIRQAWEELTLHPARRLRAALFAHPETRAPLGSPPILPRRRAPPAGPGGDEPAAIGSPFVFAELAPRPSLVVALGVATSARRDDVPPSLEEDPHL